MTTCEQIALEQLKPTLESDAWRTGPLYFIGDVGGTNARLGFAHETAEGGVAIRFVLFAMSAGTVDQLHDFFKAILETLGPNRKARKAITSRIANGALSVPGPCISNQVAGPFNNLKGITRVNDYPAELFPRGRSALLNDLEAGAFGVLAVSDAGTFHEYFTVLWKGTHWETSQAVGGTTGASVPPVGSTLGRGRCFVVAPGTGLGSSLITYNGVQDRYDVLPLEYGSQTVTYAKNPIGGDKYIPFLSESLKLKPSYAPNWEHVCSGRALSVNYAYLMSGNGARAPPSELKPPGQVARLAQQGDTVALKAMSIYFQHIFSCCGEATMAFLPLTCVLIGDNIIKNRFFFEKDSTRIEAMRNTMMQHPMEQDFSFLSRTTLLRQIKPVNLNLMGCYGFGKHFTTDSNGARQPATSSKL